MFVKDGETNFIRLIKIRQKPLEQDFTVVRRLGSIQNTAWASGNLQLRAGLGSQQMEIIKRNIRNKRGSG